MSLNNILATGVPQLFDWFWDYTAILRKIQKDKRHEHGLTQISDSKEEKSFYAMGLFISTALLRDRWIRKAPKTTSNPPKAGAHSHLKLGWR